MAEKRGRSSSMFQASKDSVNSGLKNVGVVQPHPFQSSEIRVWRAKVDAHTQVSKRR